MSSRPFLQTTPGKRIALPTRVKPKVFFANERTFLSWLNFAVILGGLAVGLVNFSSSTARSSPSLADRRAGWISGGLFTLVALAAMVYALYTFHWRARSIRRRGQSGFDDRFGPTVLTIALIAAIIVNFVLRLSVARGDAGNGDGTPGGGGGAPIPQPGPTGSAAAGSVPFGRIELL